MSVLCQLQNGEEASIRQRIDSLTSDPLRRNVLRWALLSPPEEEMQKPATRREASLWSAQNSIGSTHASSSECVINADSPLCCERRSSESVAESRSPVSEESCLTAMSDTMRNWVDEKYDGMPTTIKMRNLPKSYTNTHLIDLLHHYEYLPHVDFIYVFIRSIQRNVGVAVINFTSHTEALQFLTQFQGFDLWNLMPGTAPSSAMPISLEWYDTLQGRNQLISYYRDGPIMHQLIPNNFRPLLFNNGVPQEFPAPLRVVRRPQKRILQLLEELELESSDAVQNQPLAKKVHRPTRFRAQKKLNNSF